MAILTGARGEAAGCCERGDSDTRACCVGEYHCGEVQDGDMKKKGVLPLPELQGGGLAVVAAGPGTMAREVAQSAVQTVLGNPV